MMMSIVDHELPDYTHNLYDVTFYENTISTIVTNTPSYVDSWIAEIERIHRRHLHRLIVGLDVEWRPNQSRNSDNPVAILQLCVGKRCLVFQILHSPTVPESLKNFLRNPSYTFAGVGIESDVEKLTVDYNLVVANMADVRALAAVKYGVRELQNAGLKSLTMTVLGKEISKPKGVTMSRWDNEWLTPAQVQYASIDAFLSFKIGRTVISGNQN
ncbi:Werner Syndrome-like exonuclease [Cynara cardunculus var. scolymus]|uniref:3'-5' exonuclease domain-containing protein n=1 Tax=Cynara cardunculus var. scolymus TaxID=59895 RepID=A0A103YDM5_CYNCS|nr:Werner Syndrome-like exonuclease [Cynara cardunculus var. scolymus]KVI07167.1 3'-5' exonuclease domain-containing protein [Cynara cardunculus var. scolymus]